jgi:hypothetical protein
MSVRIAYISSLIARPCTSSQRHRLCIPVYIFIANIVLFSCDQIPSCCSTYPLKPPSPCTTAMSALLS